MYKKRRARKGGESVATPTLNLVTVVTEGVTNIQDQVMSLLPVVGGAAIVIVGGFLGIRLAIRAFRQIG